MGQNVCAKCSYWRFIDDMPVWGMCVLEVRGHPRGDILSFLKVPDSACYKFRAAKKK